ncbi:isoprenylcysteine carboxyl methyltransferase family protein [Acidimangrovimonas sediminis]|uniref:isoprenylcysteine carboxyl methyltransferase family protein n=1 Tax=Acidimangrovimonas sediminis TaxID=2056283 RepID=UPI000C805536|nr:isoprenylcysteine carboxylmethyltransferase family protein [Acidimangrovimonas sediminis]
MSGAVNPAALIFMAVVMAQRLAELALARRNTARLLAQGAHEHGAGHYPVMVALHTAWILGLAWFGRDAALHPGWLALWVMLQALRVWILASLGARWTTRIIVLDAPLVRRGPYRILRHPNYALVVAEIAVTPLVLGLWPLALVFSALNAAMLWWRIRAENAALRPARDR